jgi:hypothetical protein
MKIFEGRVISTFNAIDSMGDNWIIEVKNQNGFNI